MGTDNAVARIMDKAEGSSREVLFAGLQAATIVIVDMELGLDRVPLRQRLSQVERALDVGAPYGSPEELASRKA